ncbi:EamA family transporter [Robertmurraya sp. DFI.2.37]|uniref:DMT family transporter n=1 Tax=Robertmurraya sp. DFI.2.37 TaxID=3031819 RepID=UPI001246FE49|nr:EamA family transporter [Robertmurraya sp. DFI.2.37]MDF1507784.1 EamA family transporter [Robertmurraya sp. DFI.2.37]
MKKILPYIMIAFGAALWGLIAIFVRELKEAGLTEMEIVTVRVTFAAIFLLIVGAVSYREQLQVQLKKLPFFVGTGIFSIAFFNYCYFFTINELSVSIAVILLYTSPAFVTILSFIFLKEPLHKQKIIAVVGTILGCVFIVGVGVDQGTTITLLGVLTGLGSGLGYALYSIFGKVALKHEIKPFTVTLYTFVIAAIALLPFSGIWVKLDVLFSSRVLFVSVGLGLVPTVIAYLAYTWGLEKTESSKAAIIATVEPVVAMLIGFVIFQENLGISQLFGAFLIFLAVMIVNLPVMKGNEQIKHNKNTGSIG